MNQYIVIRHYNTDGILPDVKGEFASKEDALVFATLCHKTDTEHRYSVARLIAVTAM